MTNRPAPDIAKALLDRADHWGVCQEDDERLDREAADALEQMHEALEWHRAAQASGSHPEPLTGNTASRAALGGDGHE